MNYFASELQLPIEFTGCINIFAFIETLGGSMTMFVTVLIDESSPHSWCVPSQFRFLRDKFHRDPILFIIKDVGLLKYSTRYASSYWHVVPRRQLTLWVINRQAVVCNRQPHPSRTWEFIWLRPDDPIDNSIDAWARTSVEGKLLDGFCLLLSLAFDHFIFHVNFY